jgi:hypothetical protein
MRQPERNFVEICTLTVYFAPHFVWEIEFELLNSVNGIGRSTTSSREQKQVSGDEPNIPLMPRMLPP